MYLSNWFQWLPLVKTSYYGRSRPHFMVRRCKISSWSNRYCGSSSMSLQTWKKWHQTGLQMLNGHCEWLHAVLIDANMFFRNAWMIFRKQLSLSENLYDFFAQKNNEYHIYIQESAYKKKVQIKKTSMLCHMHCISLIRIWRSAYIF